MRWMPKGVFLLGTFFILITATSGTALNITSIQLVGNNNGFSCDASDLLNDMELVAAHSWMKLKFINEPEDPDTIFFLFTKNNNYLPEHWGWSGVWGIAALEYNPQNIAAILPDSGYYYFHFNDSSYNYVLDRPVGEIGGAVTADNIPGAPQGTNVILFDSLLQAIGTYKEFADSTFRFEHLPPSVYSLTASAPGYRDTSLSDIDLGAGESKWFSIHLVPDLAVLISTAYCERVENGVFLNWVVSDAGSAVGFDIYRGTEPELSGMEKRNRTPVYSYGTYRFFDPCENPYTDLYYYLAEAGGDEPSGFGPILAKGISADFRNALGQNYPNPFNPATTIPYTVGAEGIGRPVDISFYDVAGRLVETHALGGKQIGRYTYRWNPSLSKRGNIPSGVYYCRLRIGKETYTRKLILIR